MGSHRKIRRTIAEVAGLLGEDFAELVYKS